MSLFAELKRRNVFKVAAAYIIVGWLLMQVGDTLAPALHLPEWINSALAFFLILGFPVAVIFAWAFEMTPEGLKKESDVDRERSITSLTGRKLNTTITVLMALALGYFAFDKFVLDPGRDAAQVERALQTAEGKAAAPAESGPPQLSIAVLPFVNMSADEANEYFSDGLTEELLNILAKIRELQVAGRTSSFAFKGQNDDLRLIGEKLNVKSILEGSVRKDDQRNRVRITAQLVNADDGYHLWSETYDRELDDIFAIQEEIAHEVAKALRVTLLGEGGDPAQVADTDFGAYDLYLKALQGINEGGYDDLDRAANQLHQALAIDPGYVPARLALVNAWSEMANTGAITRAEAVERGMPVLEGVLDEQPYDSDAHVELALLNHFQGDREAADREYVRALELNPRSARALQEYGRFLFEWFEPDRGLALIDEALKIEPYALRILWDKCQASAYLQLTEPALAAAEKIRELEPESPLGYYGRALAHLYNGDIARGIKGYDEAIERDPGDYEMIAAMAIFWSWLGDVDQARAWLQRAEAIGAGQPVPINARLQLYGYLEQYDQARDLARRSLERNLEDRHGINFRLRHANAYVSVLEGDIEAALAPYRKEFPWAFGEAFEPTGTVGWDADDLLIIADLLKRSDPLSERPAQLLGLVEGALDTHHPALGPWHKYRRRAAIEALRGDLDAAIADLERTFEMGYRAYWRTFIVQDPVMLHLQNEPGYRDLVARFEADMERQRDIAYELMGVDH